METTTEIRSLPDTKRYPFRSILLLFAATPVLIKIIFAKLISELFVFHPFTWFPFVVLLNTLYPSQDNNLYRFEHSTIRTTLGFFALTVFFTLVFVSDNETRFYFWSTVIANGVSLFALVIRQDGRDDGATEFSYYAACILLISPFSHPVDDENSVNIQVFKLFGGMVIVLLCILPWLRIGSKFRIRILNILSAYFLVLSLLVCDIGELPKYSLMDCVMFILFCSLFVFDEITTSNERRPRKTKEHMKENVKINAAKGKSLVSGSIDDDVERSESSGDEEIVEEKPLPGVLFKTTPRLDPVLESRKPTSEKFILKEHTSISTLGRQYYSSKLVGEIHETSVDEGVQEQASRDSAVSTPMSIDGYMQDCLLYCSLFPAGYEFTRDILVWSWMAAGMVRSEKEHETEATATTCFEELITQKCISQSGYDSLSDQVLFKIENGYTAFVDHRNAGVRYRKGLGSGLATADLEHLSLIFKEIDQDQFEIIKKCTNLKTLLLHQCNMSKVENFLDDLLLNLKSLTTLDLSSTSILELPSSVVNLRSLAFLNMSRTSIRWLPASIDSLRNLETLVLLGCSKLTGLPRGISKLTNLQHLALDIRLQLHSTPTGIGSLTKLQTLRAFPVGRKDGHRIVELRYMNQLQGSLCICKLENVPEAEEAENARLCDKEYLTELEFLWSDLQDVKVAREEEILKNLRPHFEIQKLRIGFYSGGVLPSWMSDPSFTKIVDITLSWCRYCEVLPSFGDLPSLKCLSIVEMDGVVNVDSSFCHKEANNSKPAFPKLEKLSFEGMSNMMQWTGVGDGDFGCLHQLVIKFCPRLVSLPCLSHLDSLQHLEISHCEKLDRWPEGELPTSITGLLLKDCPNLGV